MHIGVVSDTNYRTDPRIQNEVKCLIAAGHRVSILNATYENKGGVEQLDGAKVYDVVISKRWQSTFKAIQNSWPVYERFWRRKISEFCHKVRPDALHVHDLYMAKAARNAIGTKTIPMVLDLHENFPAAVRAYSWANQFPKRLLVRPKKWQSKEKAYLSFADKLVVLSQHYKELLCDRYDFLAPNNVFVYPNVPDVQQLKSYKSDLHHIGQEGDTVLFYFGVIARRRGLHTVLEGMRKVLAEGYKFHLLVIGPIDKADRALFDSYFQDPILMDHISYYPWKEMAEFPSYVRSSHIGLSPLVRNDQHESGIANKVYQYMLFEKPVLVSNCGPQQDLIERYDCGWVFKSEDTQDMERVLKIIAQSKDRNQKGENGRRAVEQFENLESRGKVLIDLYAHLEKEV